MKWLKVSIVAFMFLAVASAYASGGLQKVSGTISALLVNQDTTHRFVTDADKTNWNGYNMGQFATGFPNTSSILTDETILASIEIPANTLQPGDTVKVIAHFSISSGQAQLRTARIRWGANSLASPTIGTVSTASTTNTVIRCVAYMNLDTGTGASNQQFYYAGSSWHGAGTGTNSMANKDISQTEYIVITGTAATAAENVKLICYSVEIER